MPKCAVVNILEAQIQKFLPEQFSTPKHEMIQKYPLLKLMKLQD